MANYNRGIVPGNPQGLPKFLRQELEKIQTAFGSISASWASVTGKPANVTALGALVGAADQVPYFTGVGAMALASLTPYARTIIACANAAAARTVLGLGALAVLDAVTESTIVLADNTTDNVSPLKHGFAPKGTNTGTKYLDDTGGYSTPAGSGTFPPALPAFPVISGLAGRFSAEPTVSTLTLNTDARAALVTDAAGAWGSNLAAAGTARPRWMKRAMNYLRPGFVFDGATAKFTATGTKIIAQPLTVIMVVQNWKGGAANNNLFRDTGSGPVTFQSGTTQWSIFAGSTLSSTALMDQNLQQNPDGMIAAPTIIISVFNGGSSILGNNGVEVTGAAGASGISGTMNVGGDGSTSFMHAVLYEVLFYSKALSLSERGQLNSYYATALDIQL